MARFSGRKDRTLLSCQYFFKGLTKGVNYDYATRIKRIIRLQS